MEKAGLCLLCGRRCSPWLLRLRPRVHKKGIELVLQCIGRRTWSCDRPNPPQAETGSEAVPATFRRDKLPRKQSPFVSHNSTAFTTHSCRVNGWPLTSMTSSVLSNQLEIMASSTCWMYLAPPPNKAFFRQPMVNMVNSPLIRPYFLRGGIGGVPSGSHDCCYGRISAFGGTFNNNNVLFRFSC